MAQRSVDILISQLRTNPEAVTKLKEKPLETLQAMALDIKSSNPPTLPQQDKFTYRMAVAVLSLVVLIVAGSISYSVVWVTPPLQQAPDILVAIGSTALGALAGILAPFGQQS
ncbi:MAG TPA: hypothetical protein VM468_16740 [Mycoplana sp.]|jgi:hypothetical protein|nr:hypothetical protein [Mycoplana sp.]